MIVAFMQDHRLINYSYDCQAEACKKIPRDFQDPGFDKLLQIKFK